MKRVASIICILGVIAAVMSGCGSGAGDADVSAGPGFCTKKSILSQLKNDDTPEFVLDGHYYALPANVSEFLSHGWEMWFVLEYEGQKFILQERECVTCSLTKRDYCVYITLANNSDAPLDMSECDVISIYVEGVGIKPDFFVTKYGITTACSAKDVEAVLEDKQGYKKSSGMLYLTSDGELGERDILHFSDMDEYTVIKVASASEQAYSQYNPLKMRAEEQSELISAYKADVEKNCPSDYTQIVEEMESGEILYAIPFCSIDGTVIQEIEYESDDVEDFLYVYAPDPSLYVVEDKSGQMYCIFHGYVTNGFLRFPVLKEGDVVSVWGYSSKAATLSDAHKVPIVIPAIIEKDGEVIYLDD